MLDAQYVDNVTDLTRWAKLASFDTCLMPVAADKIRDALAREISACGTEITAGAAGAADAAGALQEDNPRTKARP